MLHSTLVLFTPHLYFSHTFMRKPNYTRFSPSHIINLLCTYNVRILVTNLSWIPLWNVIFSVLLFPNTTGCYIRGATAVPLGADGETPWLPPEFRYKFNPAHGNAWPMKRCTVKLCRVNACFRIKYGSWLFFNFFLRIRDYRHISRFAI